MAQWSRQTATQRRHRRVRRRVQGTAERPRLTVFRSLRHIGAQLIDDAGGKTLVSASSQEKSVLGGKRCASIEVAKKVGELVAERALQQQVKQVVFDRGGFLYHGQVKALADAARGKGLDF